jgi:hypothetical protein
MGPSAGLDTGLEEKSSAFVGDQTSIASRPAHSQTLYCLSYRMFNMKFRKIMK